MLSEYAIGAVCFCLLASMFVNLVVIVLALFQWFSARQDRKEILADVRKLTERHDLAQQELRQITAINNERMLSAIRMNSNDDVRVEKRVDDIDKRNQMLVDLVSDLRSDSRPPSVTVEIDNSKGRTDVDGDLNGDFVAGDQNNGTVNNE